MLYIGDYSLFFFFFLLQFGKISNGKKDENG